MSNPLEMEIICFAWKKRAICTCLWLAFFTQSACCWAFESARQTTLPPPATTEKYPDRQDLVAQLIGYARNSDPAGQQKLVNKLSSIETLERLDTVQEKLYLPADKLNISKVFLALMENPSTPAKQSLVALTRATAIKNCGGCMELLIKALATVRPAPPEVIRFWDTNSTPDSIYSHFVVEALCDNGTTPAIALLEKKMIDPEHDADQKVTWMRTSILGHRYDIPLLQGALRVLSTTLPKDLRANLVEALFEYHREWFPPDSNSPQPPSITTASPAAIGLLKQIGNVALGHVTLTKTQKAAVNKFMREHNS